METCHKATEKLQFLAAIILTFSFTCHLVESREILQRPKIWLSRFLETKANVPTASESQFRDNLQFRNLYVSKNGSDYVAFEETREVVFTCEAEYPIAWEIPTIQHVNQINFHNIDTREYRISTFGHDKQEPINVRFKSLLQFYFDRTKFISVNLTCGSTELRPQLQASVYLYRKGGIIMEHVTERKRLFASGTSNIVIPCRPASPDLIVSLEKCEGFVNQSKGRSKQTWTTVSVPSKDIWYDPKVGFTLRHESLGSNIFGEYRCSASLDNNSTEGKYFAHFSVTNATKSDSISVLPTLFPKSVLHGNSSVRMVSFSSHPQSQPTMHFVCCSGVPNEPPKLFMQWCGNHLGCELLKRTITDVSTENGFTSRRRQILNGTSDCAVGELYGTSQIVVCQGDNVNFMDHYMRLFNSAQISSGATSRVQYENSGLAESALAIRKLMLLVGKRVYKPLNGSSEVHFSAAYKDMLGEDGADDDVPKGLTLDAEIKQRTSFTHFVEHDKDEYYDGESLIFMCFGSKLMFGQGSHLRLWWKNDTSTEIRMEKRANPAKPLSSRLLYLKGNATIGNGDELTSIFGEEIHAKPEMVKVTCWMPLAGSSKWTSIMRPFIVRPKPALQ